MTTMIKWDKLKKSKNTLTKTNNSTNVGVKKAHCNNGGATVIMPACTGYWNTHRAGKKRERKGKRVLKNPKLIMPYTNTYM